MKLIPLEWDSLFFGLRIAKIILNSQEEAEQLMFLKDNISSEYDLVYVFSDLDVSFHGAQSYLVGQKTTYKVQVTNSTFQDDHIMEYVDDTVSDPLLQLALVSGRYSRFRVDKHFPDQSYERLYARWIEQSVRHQISTEVFCYMVHHQPVGLVTLKRDADSCDIGLVATHPKFQRQGIAYKLLSFVNQFLYAKGCCQISVVTQRQNIPACHLYEKAGYMVSDVKNIWHWWLR